MQRIALLAAAAALFLAGCQAQRKPPALGPLPEPPLVTRAPQVVTPKPPPVAPRPAPETGEVRLPLAQMQPAGGIRKNLWQTIVVHHAASPTATPAGMDAWHKRRGWDGLGYHFVIGNGVNFPDGEIYVGPRWRQQKTGAHCKTAAGRFFGAFRPGGYFNDRGIGICLIGDFDRDRPTRKQLLALEKLTAWLCENAGVSPSSVYGHGEVTHKTACPGRHLSLDTVRAAVSQISAHSE